ncbi:hypothetical protein FF1_027416 [Malus domestica]
MLLTDPGERTSLIKPRVSFPAPTNSLQLSLLRPWSGNRLPFKPLVKIVHHLFETRQRGSDLSNQRPLAKDKQGPPLGDPSANTRGTISEAKELRSAVD